MKTGRSAQPQTASAAARPAGSVPPAGGAGEEASVGIGGGMGAWLAGLSRWVASAVSMGVGMSIVIHAAMLAAAAVMSVGIAQVGGGGSRQAREYEITTTEAALTGVDDAPLAAETPAVANADLPELPTAGVLDGAGGVDAPASGDGLGEVAEGLGGAGGGDIGDGAGLGSGGAGGGAANFFGVEARGSRFAYVVDVSGSMKGEKLAALKHELNESVGAMLEHMSFMVCPFSSMAMPLAERRKWTDATDAGKQWCRQNVVSIEAEGGTEPWGALELVLNMRPAPDAIYFMTDGQFDPQVADQLAMRNRGGKKIPIHCIAFGNDAAEELMRRIASDSGGTYAFVKVSQ